MPGWVSLQNHIGQNRTIIQIPIGKVFITILCYQLITSNANKIHTNQHMLSHDVYWLHGCSVGVWWLAYRCSYHLFQYSQRYCSCCFLIVVGHFTFRAQLVVVQKVRSTITGLRRRLHDSVFNTKTNICSPFWPSVYTQMMKTHTQTGDFWIRRPKWRPWKRILEKQLTVHM